MKNYSAARETYEKLLALAPRSGLVLNNLAYLYSEHLGDLDKAYEAGWKARELRPEDPSAADTFGWILYKRGDYARALPLLRESAEKVPGSSEVLYHLGMCHYMVGDEAAARGFLERALQPNQEFPGRAEAAQRLSALSLDPNSADPQTIAALEKMLAESPRDPIVLMRLAAVYERNRSPDKAAKLYQTALLQNPRNLVANVKLAQIYSEPLPDAAKAIQYARAARTLAPDDPAIAHTLGRLALRAREFVWALGLLQESRQELPANPDVLFDLAHALVAVGRVAEAEETMRKALELQPQFPQAAAASNFVRLTGLLLKSTPAELSAPEVDALIQKDPDSLASMAVKGRRDELAGNTAAARQAFEEILKQFPLFTPAHRSLASLYLQPPPDEARAYEHGTKARAAFPNDAAVAGTLGEIFFRRGEFARATQLLRESSRQQPAPRTFFFLGLSLHELKQKADSQQALRRALELGLPSDLSEQANRILNQAP
jgi:Tfp pilus assembly protein PilF